MKGSVITFSMVPFVGDKVTEKGSTIRLVSVAKIQGPSGRLQGVRLRMPRSAGMQFHAPAQHKTTYGPGNLLVIDSPTSIRTYRLERVVIESWAEYAGEVVVTMSFWSFTLFWITDRNSFEFKNSDLIYPGDY